jgi:hypothetical protein
MKSPEVTSKRVAAIAGKVLRLMKYYKHLGAKWQILAQGDDYVTLGEIKALAGSALTQAKDKPKGKRKA